MTILQVPGNAVDVVPCERLWPGHSTIERQREDMKIDDGLYGFFWRSMEANNCNTYLIDGSRRILIDPGHHHLFDHVVQGLAAIGVTPDEIDMVICTHAHPDHVEAVQALKSERTVFAIHRSEWQMMQQWAGHTGNKDLLEQLRPDLFLQAGQLDVGEVALTVVETPGHSPGSICLYWSDRKALISGDLVFAGGVGRTDLPGGDPRLLRDSIRRVAREPVDLLLPGHGDMVSGAAAVRANFQQIETMFF